MKSERKRRGKIWLLVIGLVSIACLAALYVSVQHNDPAVAELRKLAIGSTFERENMAKYGFRAGPSSTRGTGVSVTENLYFDLQPEDVHAHIVRLFGSRITKASHYTQFTDYQMRSGYDVNFVMCVLHTSDYENEPQGTVCCVTVGYQPNWFDKLAVRWSW